MLQNPVRLLACTALASLLAALSLGAIGCRGELALEVERPDVGAMRDADTPIERDMLAPPVERDAGSMPGDDDMGSTDPGPQDMGAMSGDEDMGSTDPGPRDMGAMDGVIPPRTRACPSGPLDAPVDGCRPAPPPSTGDPYLDCVRRINQFRWECQCLPPLERWTEGESCADQQAQYDADNNTPHKGFRDNVCSPRGFAQNECPRWGSWDRVIGGCLQQMWDEGPGEPFSEHGHYINMSSQRYTRVACGQGGGWYVQNFQ